MTRRRPMTLFARSDADGQAASRSERSSLEHRGQSPDPGLPGLRLLFATAENHPTHRPDVRLLFGKFLPAIGVRSDLVAAVGTNGPAEDWGGGGAFLRRFSTKAGFALVDLLQQFSLFRLALRGYDGLVVRDKPFLGLLGLAAARLAGIPFVYWMSFPLAEAYLAIARNQDGDAGPKRRIYAWLRGRTSAFTLYRLIVPLADHVFVQSDAMLSHLRLQGLRHDRVTPVPMGVDMDACPGTAPRGDDGAPCAVYLGTLNRLRRRELEAMVDAAREVAKEIPGFALLVVGESELENEQGWLRRYAESHGAAHCTRFFGWLPYEEGLAIASQASVGLSPVPRGELFDMGSPTKAIEYLALGLPVVCNDQPDQDRVIRESGGGYSVDMSPPAFAGAIEQLLRDPLRARQMSDAGRAWVAEHRDYRRLAAAVAGVLRQTCGRRVARP